jgi:hypothetical protein
MRQTGGPCTCDRLALLAARALRTGTPAAPVEGMRTRVRASDRRHVTRNTRLGEPCRRELTSTILASYEQKPGLTLNIHQAARLFTLQPRTCQVVLEDLVRDGALQRAPDGGYTDGSPNQE